MRLHGGRIGIFSEGEGKGSTFLVDLPISRNQVHTNVINHCNSGIHTKNEEITFGVKFSILILAASHCNIRYITLNRLCLRRKLMC